jgi:hypothetical protein
MWPTMRFGRTSICQDLRIATLHHTPDIKKATGMVTAIGMSTTTSLTTTPALNTTTRRLVLSTMTMRSMWPMTR